MHILIENIVMRFILNSRKQISVAWKFRYFSKQCREIQIEGIDIATKTLLNCLHLYGWAWKIQHIVFPFSLVRCCYGSMHFILLCQLSLQCTTICRENERKINISVNYAHEKWQEKEKKEEIFDDAMLFMSRGWMRRIKHQQCNYHVSI